MICLDVHVWESFWKKAILLKQIRTMGIGLELRVGYKATSHDSWMSQTLFDATWRTVDCAWQHYLCFWSFRAQCAANWELERTRVILRFYSNKLCDGLKGCWHNAICAQRSQWRHSKQTAREKRREYVSGFFSIATCLVIYFVMSMNGLARF